MHAKLPRYLEDLATLRMFRYLDSTAGRLALSALGVVETAAAMSGSALDPNNVKIDRDWTRLARFCQWSSPITFLMFSFIHSFIHSQRLHLAAHSSWATSSLWRTPEPPQMLGKHI